MNTQRESFYSNIEQYELVNSKIKTLEEKLSMLKKHKKEIRDILSIQACRLRPEGSCEPELYFRLKESKLINNVATKYYDTSANYCYPTAMSYKNGWISGARGDFWDLPNRPCVYVLKNEHGVILYIGKSKDPRSRLRTHHRQKPEWTCWETFFFGSEEEALKYESAAIKQYRPKFNIAGVK